MPYMYDKELTSEILSQISTAVHLALERFEVVTDVSYFTDTPQYGSGVEYPPKLCHTTQKSNCHTKKPPSRSRGLSPCHQQIC